MNRPPYSIEELVADETFQAYCKQTDPAAIHKWENYLQQFPAQKQTVDEARAIIRMFELQLSEAETQIEQDKFFNALDQQSNRFSKQRRFFLLAASTAAAAILALGFFFYFSPTKPLLSHQSDDLIKELTLPDGSTVFLDKNTKIQFAENWTAKEDRQVWLEGKAFFEVQKTPAQGGQKFIIHTTLGEVQVLGTSFVLDSRMETFEVVLEEGKLSFSDIHDESTFLQPGERIFLNAGKIKLEKTEGRNYSIWKDKAIKFENTSISEVVASLEASYRLDIEVTNKALLDRNITATIPVNDILLFFEALSEIYDITIQNEEGKILMK